MTERLVQDVRVQRIIPLMTPRELRGLFPLTDTMADTVVNAREAIGQAVTGHDGRLVVVVGPCSIHNEATALEYAHRLAPLARELADRILIIMRAYFEKPRTILGWKGLINDPNLDGTCEIGEGLMLARRIAHAIVSLGLPIGMEALDPAVMRDLSDLLAWIAIGARTSESPTHRELASGLSAPVGFKNNCEGSLVSAVNAVLSARSSHTFLGVNDEGRRSIIRTTGNPFGHVVLRGGNDGPNYSEASVSAALALLCRADLPQAVMIDCSHGNSGKDHKKQREVLLDVARRRVLGEHGIVGVMIESNLKEGRQEIPTDLSQLVPGVSITDACIGWEETEELLREVYRILE